MSSPTLRGSGRSKAAGAELEAICRRCTSPLGFIDGFKRTVRIDS